MKLITLNSTIKVDLKRYTENPDGNDTNENNVLAVFNPKDGIWYYKMGYHYVVPDNKPWTIIMGDKAWDKLVFELKWPTNNMRE